MLCKRHRCFVHLENVYEAKSQSVNFFQTLETMVEELEGSRKIIEEQKRLLEDSKLTGITLSVSG